MLLESLIKDEQRVTFDCCKATVIRGVTVEIADIHYSAAEIRNAIKLGLVRLVGPEPVSQQSMTALVRKIKLRNRTPHLLTLECIKGSVASGSFVDIPENLMNEREIQNALAWNMLEDVENPRPVMEAGDPLSLDEISVGDIELASQEIPTTSKTPVARPNQQQRPNQSQRPRVNTARRAVRPIHGGGDSDVNLYSESSVRDQKPTRRRAAGSSGPIPIDVDSSGPISTSLPEISFDEIFEGQ